MQTPDIRIADAPMQTLIQVEAARMQLRVSKQELCAAAGVKAEMYSYMMRRGRQGHDLPDDCLQKILGAIKKLRTKKRP